MHLDFMMCLYSGRGHNEHDYRILGHFSAPTQSSRDGQVTWLLLLPGANSTNSLDKQQTNEL